MRKARLIALLLAMCLVLNGCSAAQQVEDQAFVILLGADLDKERTLELTAQIPKIAGKSGGEDSGGGSGANYLVATAKAETFTEAVELLSLAIPREVNLVQVKMLAISEELASDSRFKQLLWEMAETYQLYGTARLVVCMGKAGELIKNQEPVIGSRISTGVTAMLEHYEKLGYTPESTFADVYYRTNSIYSDPMVILAGSGGGASADAAQEIPAEIFPDEVPAELKENKNEYLGAALLKDGAMVGKLNARQTLFANLISGKSMQFNYTFEGYGMTLTPKASPKIKIDTKGAPLRITYEQTLVAVPLTEMPDISAVEEQLAADFLDVMKMCQELDVEPFGLAESAAKAFLTIEDWNRYGWQSHFSVADIKVNIHVEKLNE